ncbi:hypothetical protein QMW01_15780 [Klebsiella pneumoniae]|uniref:hypothetical protein n=1 Tax=Klebsiella pneumoniae TaxID=573 RepID=UPI0024BC273B|nr:hypothetical protein [Klebsiella pneumoniae]MDJ1012827.1 hypothetical protein [Klebsiella pneumoniae]
MTTDITELAQREKFEAWWEREYKHLESSKYTDTVPHIKYGFWAAYQAGGSELVEALEKAQAQSSKWLEAYHKAVSIGARYEERIAELESRTVTVKLPELCVGVVQSGHAVMVPYAGGHWFNKTAILEMLTAAGIKWEAE